MIEDAWMDVVVFYGLEVVQLNKGLSKAESSSFLLGRNSEMFLYLLLRRKKIHILFWSKKK